MLEQNFDILVIGAGSTGIVAALQAARTGCKTLLIEKNAMPGGTMTAGAIAFPGLFYAWKKQIIAGIGWELVSEAAAESGLALPKFEEQIGMTKHPQYQVRLNPLIYAALADEKLSAAGVYVLYHAMIAGIKFTDGGAEALICTRDGLKTIQAKRIIDCTGDAGATELAGFEVLHPFPCQPGSYSCRLSGYDLQSLDWETLNKNAVRAAESGEILFTDLGWKKDAFNGHILSKAGNNSNHIFPSLPPHSAEGRSQLERSGRASLLRAWRFLKRQPGLENLQIEMSAVECGVRESSVIKGEYTITGEDYVSARKFPDALCNAFYPVDLHDVHGVTPRHLPEGAVPQVPLRSLIPRGSDYLLTAGRAVSSDRKANSALRVQASCMAMGQAAAAAACISLADDCPVSQVDIFRVRTLLKAHQAILPAQ